MFSQVSVCPWGCIPACKWQRGEYSRMKWTGVCVTEGGVCDQDECLPRPCVWPGGVNWGVWSGDVTRRVFDLRGVRDQGVCVTKEYDQRGMCDQWVYTLPHPWTHIPPGLTRTKLCSESVFRDQVQYSDSDLRVVKGCKNPIMNMH